MIRKEHLDWCKQRANEYLDNNDATLAVTSMLSDLRKHEETENHVGAEMAIVGHLLTNLTVDSARTWIDGFN